MLGRPFPTLNLLKLGIREWHALLYVIFRAEDEELTQDQVYSLMDEYGLDSISVKILEAMSLAWPKMKETSKKKVGKKRGK